MTGATFGERLASVRKRRGLTQRELAKESGVSVSLIRMLEQGTREDTRLETARKLARALRVKTTVLSARADADDADADTVAQWESVRRALVGQVPRPDEEPTADGVSCALAEMKRALAENRYTEIVAFLPQVIRDAEALNGDSRPVRSRLLNMTAWLLVMTRQFDAAQQTVDLALDAADDRLDAAAAINTNVWLLLRQGRLAEARELSARWADDIEPRFSRATVAELALWGRLLLGITSAAIRDNRPGEAEDAMRLATAAAARIGRECVSDTSTARTFGPITVKMIRGENAVIAGQPDRVLAIAGTIPGNLLHAKSASRNRHRLDVACAQVDLRNYAGALDTLHSIRRDAPEWIAQQRYAKDILGRIVAKRRTLTPEVMELADFIKVPY